MASKSLWRRLRPGSSRDLSGAEREKNEDVARPTHLYILVHGFNSRADHLQYMAAEMRSRLGPDATVYLSSCNQAKVPTFFMHPTHNGIDRGGERLAQEIRDVVAKPENCNLKYISFLGNSMGGLFIRFSLGLLFDVETGECDFLDALFSRIP
jgi:hypothetical protein